MNVSAPLLTDEDGGGMYCIALRLLCYVCEHHSYNGYLRLTELCVFLFTCFITLLLS